MLGRVLGRYSRSSSSIRGPSGADYRSKRDSSMGSAASSTTSFGSKTSAPNLGLLGTTPECLRPLGEDGGTADSSCRSSRKSRASGRKSRAAHTIGRLGDAKGRESSSDNMCGGVCGGALYGGSCKSRRASHDLSSSQGIASPLYQVPTSLDTTQLQGQNLFATPDRLNGLHGEPAIEPRALGGGLGTFRNLPPPRSGSAECRRPSFTGALNLGRHSATPLHDATRHSGSAKELRRSSTAPSGSLAAPPPRMKSRDAELEKSINMVRRTSRMVNKPTQLAEGSVSRGPLSAKCRFRQAANTATVAAHAASPRNAFGIRFSGRASQERASRRSSRYSAEDSSAPRLRLRKPTDDLAGGGGGGGGEETTTSQLARQLDEERPEISSEMIAQHLRPCSLSLLLILLLFGPYDAFCFDLTPGALGGATRSLAMLLTLRYAVCVPLCAAATAVVHVQLRRDLRKSTMQLLGLGLIALDGLCALVLLLYAPQDVGGRPRPMWATAVLVVHLWWMYTVLVLETVSQAALCFVTSAVGGFLVWWTQLQFDDVDVREWRIVALVGWGLIFHALGLRHAFTRRGALIKHVHHRQRSMVCAEHILEEVEACERLLENIFPPQVLDDLRDNLRLGASERAAVVAHEFEGCCFLFAKVVGLRNLVDSPHRDPHRVLALLQSIFDRFDTLAETYSVQRVRKTVNESYMVAAGLPDPSLLQTPAERALGIAGLGFAMLHVMDVVNAQLAVTLGTDEGRHDERPLLDVQVGIHCGSAIAGVIGHRRIQYDLVGDAVNTTARMCSYGAPGRVHVSGAMHAFVAAHYHATPREPMEIKGKGIMTTFFLDRRKPSAEAALPSPPPPPPPPPSLPRSGWLSSSMRRAPPAC